MSSVNFEQIFTHCFSLFIVNFEQTSHISAASRCILVPFEGYGRPKKCAQKSSCNTFPTQLQLLGVITKLSNP